MNSERIYKPFNLSFKKGHILNTESAVSIFALSFLITFICAGQEIEVPIPEYIHSTSEQLADSINLIGTSVIKSGNIFLKSGDEIAFKNLTMRNDSVFFLNGSVNNCVPVNEVMSVTRKKSTVVNGVAIGSVLGLLAGTVTGIAVNSDKPVEDIFTLLSDDGEIPDLRAEDLPYIGIGMACGAALGALAGLATKKGKVVYYKNTTVDVFPSIGFNHEKQTQFMVSVKINLGSNVSGR